MVSNTGTWMQRIAQDWLVLELTKLPLAVGITTALQFLPMLVFGLWGGLLADRYPKRRLLLITQSVMGLLAVLLARPPEPQAPIVVVLNPDPSAPAARFVASVSADGAALVLRPLDGFQPTAGRLAANLAAAGVDPASIGTVVITHAHPDHCWGILDEQGAVRFPAAEYVVSEPEWAFWMKEGRADEVPEPIRPFVLGAQRSLGAVTVNYQINGGVVQAASTAEWNGGERFGGSGDLYYRIMRGAVTGAQPGDSVKVWFTGGGKTSASFSYTVKSDTNAPVLVLAAEDYSGISPVYNSNPQPAYLSYYLDALAARGATYEVSRFDAGHGSLVVEESMRHAATEIAAAMDLLRILPLCRTAPPSRLSHSEGTPFSSIMSRPHLGCRGWTARWRCS